MKRSVEYRKMIIGHVNISYSYNEIKTTKIEKEKYWFLKKSVQGMLFLI